jgi:hypothetical protein
MRRGSLLARGMRTYFFAVLGLLCSCGTDATPDSPGADAATEPDATPAPEDAAVALDAAVEPEPAPAEMDASTELDAAPAEPSAADASTELDAALAEPPAVDASTELDAGLVLLDASSEPDAGQATVDAAVEAGVPTSLPFRVTSVVGSFAGDGVYVVDETRTDTLAQNSCTFTSPGTEAEEVHSIEFDTLSGTFDLEGIVSCPAGAATSTTAAGCTTQANDSQLGLFQGRATVEGWEDDAVVTIAILAPPSGIPGCNYATVDISADPGWGISGTTTLGAFRAGVPFDVNFVGSKTLTTEQNTSNVSWDFVATIEPSL